ncbi:hypothetical protein GCM10018980_48750 [Streptomyces capoamus]|uniref:Uncharacterized protein n=1 Tax=Streptomyces capoamus TaxID=68183 RepID=A0A919KDM7_9ACTN|nr:hypothetical protein [Streptomyces capoamus]GGW11120.1 hypothetical protein GCM10010501_07870 [Streptomyces libani subsp. rufus]GHG60355.1 hypothetical protein GCM10018980_48750 [Streptomyces capoamus]
MSDVTAHASEKPAVPDAETGWAAARRLRNRGVRTCVPAVLDGAPLRGQGPDTEDNIVRGED